MNKIPVGIIDDHKLFRSGVADIIDDTSEFEVKVSASNSAELYDQLRVNHIQLLLLDINLKGENGLDILLHLKEKRPELRIIMLTMHNESSYIKTMVQKGANGYLMKDTSPEDLIHTLKMVNKNGQYYDDHTTNILVSSMQAKEKLVDIGIHFSDLEIEILQLIASGKTADQIGKTVHKSHRTIEGYRTKLIEKTGVNNIAELVSWGYKNGVL